jgi:lipid-A-disaccharide synthase
VTIKILLSAGEVSGDQHLARVARAIKASAPNAEIRGMAGKLCEDAGVKIDVDCYRTGAGMGFFELFRSGGKILSSFKTLSNLIKEWRPDLLILVDYPDFNLRLAKVAKRHGVKVLYFIPPKVWAWRSGRVKKISRFVDRVAAIFPFESDFYSKHGYERVTYVGHPLGERAKEVELNSSSQTQELLLLPGSRRFEVERLLVQNWDLHCRDTGFAAGQSSRQHSGRPSTTSVSRKFLSFSSLSLTMRSFSNLSFIILSFSSFFSRSNFSSSSCAFRSLSLS